MANLETLTIDGVSMDNFHPATYITSSKTFSLESGSVQLWDTGVAIPKGLHFFGGTLIFPASATGSRYFQLGTYDGSTISDTSAMRTPAAPSGDTILFGYGSFNNTSDITQTLACRLFQNSGSTQTVTLKYVIRTLPTLVGGS